MSRFGRVAAAILLPVAIAAVAACNSGGVGGATGTPSVSPSAGTSAPASVEPSASAEPSSAASPSSALNQVFPKFQSMGGSSITGGAILTDLGSNQTAVTIGVVAAGITDPMPANLIPASCSDAGGAVSSPAPSSSAGTSLAPGSTIKLGDLSAGASNTVVDTSLDGLLSTPYSIQILKSATDSTVVACADVIR